MTNIYKAYFETRPGFDALRYLVSYGFLTLLARRASKRKYRFFTEISSNIDRHILTDGLFEKGVIDLLVDLTKRLEHCDILIDVGANIGNHSVALGAHFKQVESVEPHPVLFRALKANLLLNGLAQYSCHNFGLANENATATLAEPRSNHALARIKERSRLDSAKFDLTDAQFDHEYAVELKSSSEFLDQFGERLSRSFIKIDVEGMEQEIITSMRTVLEKYKPIVGFELITSSQPDLAAIVAKFDGYELWGIHSNDVGKNRPWRALKLLFKGRSFQLRRIDPDRLDDFYPLALLIPTGKMV